MPEALSEREVEILQLVATGASNKEVASRLNITESTVKVHLRNVYAKLEVRSRTEASRVAMQMGLVDGPQSEAALPRESDTTDDAAVIEGAVAPERAGALVWARVATLLLVLVAVAIAILPARPAVRVAATTLDPLREGGAGGEATAPDGGVGRWGELAQMPMGRHRFAAALIDQSIVVSAGDSPDGVTASTGVYDFASNTWRVAADKPTAVSNVSGVAVGGQMWVPGGLDPSGQVIATVEVYDPAEDRWSTAPALPLPLCAYGLATDGAALYVVGGWDGQQYRSGVYSLRLGETAWRVLPSLPAAVLHPGATWAGGRLYVLGGYDGQAALRNVWSLDTESPTPPEWQSLPAMSEGRAGAGAVAVGGALYVVGGGWKSATAFCERLDLDREPVWTPWEMPLRGAWRNMSVVADDSTIYALGGWADGIRANLLRYQAVYRVLLPITG